MTAKANAVAAKVRASKDRHPEKFCRNQRCLWRVVQRDGSRRECPNHGAPAKVEGGGVMSAGAKVSRCCGASVVVEADDPHPYCYDCGRDCESVTPAEYERIAAERSGEDRHRRLSEGGES